MSGVDHLEYVVRIGTTIGIPYALPDASDPDDSVEILRGSVVPEQALRFTRVTKGPIRADCVWTTTLTLKIVSRRFVEALSQAGCTGWSAYDVLIDCRDGSTTAVGDYFGFSIVGRCSDPDWTSSRIEPRRFAPNRPFSDHYVGAKVHEWDGSDIAIGRETTFTFCTQRFRDALRNAKIRGCEFESLDSWAVWREIVDFKASS